jgi:hypothetical protein
LFGGSAAVNDKGIYYRRPAIRSQDLGKEGVTVYFKVFFQFLNFHGQFQRFFAGAARAAGHMPLRLSPKSFIAVN